MSRNLSSGAPWFWGAVHNLIAHPLVALSFEATWAKSFHNWTAERMGHEDDLNAPPEPPCFWELVDGQLEDNPDAIEQWKSLAADWLMFTEMRLEVGRRHRELAAPSRGTLAALWLLGMALLLGVAFGLGRVAERRQVEHTQAAAPAYVVPTTPVIQGADFELVVVDPATAKAEGRGLAELWLHHADGSASRAEIRSDGRGSVVHIDGEGAEVGR